MLKTLFFTFLNKLTHFHLKHVKMTKEFFFFKKTHGSCSAPLLTVTTEVFPSSHCFSHGTLAVDFYVVTSLGQYSSCM